MFNEERKRGFLEECKTRKVLTENTFKKLEPFEAKIGRDVCEFSQEYLQEVLSTQIGGTKLDTTRQTISVIRAYIRWCEANGFVTSDAIHHITVENSEKIKNTMIASPLHFAKLLDEVFDPIELDTVDILDRCYLWLAYCGLEMKDSVRVKESEINFKEMYIEHNGRFYELYKESLPVFNKATTLKTIIVLREDNPGYMAKFPRKPGEYLLRAGKTAQPSTAAIVARIRDKINGKGYEKAFAYNKIRISGLFYRAYEKERAGITVNFDGDIISQIMADKNKPVTRKTVMRAIVKYKKEYEAWKKAFMV